MGHRGRPDKVIDWDLVDQLLMAGCLGTEIAAYFGMHPNTFYTRVSSEFNCNFSEYLQEKRSIGDALLRKAQYDKAIDKDNTMLVWLGKNRLNQKDNHDVSIDSTTVKEFASTMGWFKRMQEDKNKKPEHCSTCNTPLREFEGTQYCPTCTKDQ